MAQLPGEGKAGAVRPLLGSGPSSGREDNRVRKERSAVLCCEPEATLNPGGVFDLDSALHTHAAVLQTPHLFSGTVLENLRYGNPNATMEEIEAAVRRVSADKVIARMEHGYDSEVGEGGDLLSTGEKQLLSFARALLADPRILVLDEATSSVDTLTEKAIQDAISTVTHGRTSFVIAHRLSTIRDADVILVMRDGRVVERGTHHALLEQKGYYYRLYTQQFMQETSEEAMRVSAQ